MLSSPWLWTCWYNFRSSQSHLPSMSENNQYSWAYNTRCRSNSAYRSYLNRGFASAKCPSVNRHNKLTKSLVKLHKDSCKRKEAAKAKAEPTSQLHPGQLLFSKEKRRAILGGNRTSATCEHKVYTHRSVSQDLMGECVRRGLCDW